MSVRYATEETLRDAYQSGIQGDFAKHQALINQELETPEADVRAGVFALITQAWFAMGIGDFPLKPETVRGLAISGAGPEWLEILCGLGARERMLLFDLEGLRAFNHAHQAISKSPGARFRMDELWLTILSDGDGQPNDAGARAEQLANEAREQGNASLVIEATSAAALAALSDAGSTADATQLARRASRMARTEALPQDEYLANLILARVRRHENKPHLATRILTALVSVAPAVYHPWMNWELAFAGGDLPDHVLTRVAAAAKAGDPIALRRLCLAASEELSTIGVLGRDLAIVVRLLGVEENAELDPWQRGEGSANVPRGLFAVGSGGSGSSSDPISIIAGPGRVPRRVYSFAAALWPMHQALEPNRKRRARTDGALAALALRGGQPIDEAAFFESIYGFAYQPGAHRSSRDTLYYRIRERLGPAGTLVREHGSLSLELENDILAPEPRCSPPPEHSVLSFLALEGHSSVKAAATALGIPIRTAQHLLRALAKDGVCRVEQEGRELRYILEDTTFCEPTNVGLPASP